MFIVKFCQWQDSNRAPLVSEATTLPTGPQPLPLSIYFLQRTIQIPNSKLVSFAAVLFSEMGHNFCQIGGDIVLLFM